MRAIPTLGSPITMGAERANMAIICCIRYFQCINHSLVSSLYYGAHHGWARRNIFETKVLRWLENAIMRLVFAIQYLIRERFYQGRRKDSRARGADRSKRAPTTLGQQIYSRNGGHPRHFLGNIMGYASHSLLNDRLFQSNIACF